VGEEAGEGVAQGGEGRGGGGKPGFEPGAKAAHLEVVKAEAGRLHFLLASPFGPPVLKPDLQGIKEKNNLQINSKDKDQKTKVVIKP
jgi:hypothetical protein